MDCSTFRNCRPVGLPPSVGFAWTPPGIGSLQKPRPRRLSQRKSQKSVLLHKSTDREQKRFTPATGLRMAPKRNGSCALRRKFPLDNVFGASVPSRVAPYCGLCFRITAAEETVASLLSPSAAPTRHSFFQGQPGTNVMALLELCLRPPHPACFSTRKQS